MIMMPVEDVALGWIMIVVGAVLLLIEAYSPGFFVAVPATVLVILGILLLLGVDILNSVTGVIVGVAIALIAAAVTVWFYGKLTPDASPTTISRDSVVGLEGRVIRDLDADTISGKVAIGGVEWSARSVDGPLPAGAKVRVVRSEGVHIVVEEVK
jgi:membrane-bound ClpP family serine protease